MLTVLGAAAKLERATILARTAEGRVAREGERQEPGAAVQADARRNRAEARAMLDAGRGVCEVADVFNVSHSTISRLPA
jgi:DNA invertase Pin-like site-specific DNA recombinase